MIISPLKHDLDMKLPEGYTCRRIEAADYSRGVLTVLAQLTTVGDMTQQQFDQFITYIDSAPHLHYTLVIVDTNDKIVGVGSIQIEQKLIHSCGIVGHIEDIAVGEGSQGTGLGAELVKVLDTIGKLSGAYKNILNCSPATEAFYERCGYTSTGHMMVSPLPSIRTVH